MKRGETLVHKQLKQKIADELRSKGYNIELEKKVGRRRVDVYAEKKDEIRVVEVVHSHDSPLVKMDADKKLIQEKVYTLSYFLESPTNSVSFSVKPEDKWVVDAVKEMAREKGVSFSELICRAIEAYHGDITLIPILKDVEQWLYKNRGDMTYSEMIVALINNFLGKNGE